jgi:polygalacturonase
MRTLFAICIDLLSCAAAAAQSTSTRFDIATYGAVADGSTLNSAAINKAIEAAQAAGGRVVHFAAGTWLSGSIHLKSNVTLFLDQGATILATSDPEAYDEAEPNQWDK